MKDFTGSYGFVVVFDHETEKKAKEIVQGLDHPPEVSLELRQLTLYRAHIMDFPVDEAQYVLGSVKWLVGQGVFLRNVKVHREKFLIWEGEAETNPLLCACHLASLTMSYCLNTQAVRRRIMNEGPKLSSEERRNLHVFGDPDVRRHFRPHIPLAYDSGGFRSFVERPMEHVAWIAHVAFAEFDHNERVKRHVL